MFHLSCASKFAHSRTILNRVQYVEGVWSSFRETLRCVDFWEQNIENRAQVHFLFLIVIILWASNILLPAIQISAMQDSNSPSFSFTTRFYQYLEEHYQTPTWNFHIGSCAWWICACSAVALRMV